MTARRVRFVLCFACASLAALRAASANPLLAREWRDLNPRERYDAMQNYWRYQGLPQERQRDVEKGYERWRAMPPDERERVRQNYERLRQLGPQERERFERKYQKWRQQAEPPP